MPLGKISLLTLFFLAFGSRLLEASSLKVAWDPNTEPELAGYLVYYGTASRTYSAVVDVGNKTAVSIDAATVSGPYFVAVTAYDNLGNESELSEEVVLSPAAETVAKPQPPRGPRAVRAGESAVFTAAGAVSSDGDAVQYRFSWADGTATDWLPVGTSDAAKTWTVAATYTDVRVEARCSTHPSVVSPASDPLTVVVSAASVETVSQPSRPAGSVEISAAAPETYRTGGSRSSASEPVQYRFHWGEGTVSPWLVPGEFTAAKAWNLPGMYAVRAEARCEAHSAVCSPASDPLDVHVSAPNSEGVAPPFTPAGPVDAHTGYVYEYESGGAASSVGDPLEYRFQWGDGTVSSWLGPGDAARVAASKSWPVAAIYSVTAEARCALHPASPAVSDALGVSVTGGGSLLFADTFADGTPDGDPLWQSLSGKWSVRQEGENKVLASASSGATNRAVVTTLPAFTAGRISTRIKLGRRALAKATGVVFALTDQRHYRYVLLNGSRIVLGQVGGSPGEKAGVKAAAARVFKPGVWHTIRLDLEPTGRARVYVGRAAAPLLTYRFRSPVAGRVGSYAQKSVAYFDDFRVWDARALR